MHPLLPLLTLLFLSPTTLSLPIPEANALMSIKSSLDPQGRILTSWTLGSDPCGPSFEGVACNEEGQVANISLQGKGLTGKIPAEISALTNLTGLYLHFNGLSGGIPREISGLSRLSELYLNVNNLSGEIPPELGYLPNLQVLQLCYNNLSGSVPTQLGSLKELNVLALQYNDLTGAIPASLGDLKKLVRLDLSFNRLFGSIPVRLVDAPLLNVLDVRNNTLSGDVPIGLKRLNGGFQYENNAGLCGGGFLGLQVCSASDHKNPNKPEPFGPENLSAKNIPESAKIPANCTGNQAHCVAQSSTPQTGLAFGVVGVAVVLALAGFLSFSIYRRRKQKISSTMDSSDSRLSTDQMKEVYCRRNASPLISLEYSHGWDPLAKGGSISGVIVGFSQEVFESFMYNLEDVERATHCFSEINLLGKSGFSATYKGLLRDGSVVAVKCIAKMSCRSDEDEFLKGLKLLTSLKHENLVRLRGFCCSKGRGECFLIYEYVPNGNLLQHLDAEHGSENVLEWSTRVSIVAGIAEGIRYIHSSKGKKPGLVHQNISAGKVLLDHWNNPLLSDSGLHKLLADDVVFSALKASVLPWDTLPPSMQSRVVSLRRAMCMPSA
ncbi:hypothetical protein MLD38_023829 [Melastoma candidum]|uniref:Uncharacterized protein n=1 Tax=Melastoma candidum TaxID=119954 RepID=A0ACB9NS47_9MYRT|nr:hypothetical protein MLD38_023829 [Melastoma candidum]